MDLPEEFPTVPLRLSGYGTTSAGGHLQEAADALLDEWEFDWGEALDRGDWEYFDQPAVREIMSGRRNSDAGRAALLQVVALDALSKAIRFELAFAIAVSLECGASWGDVAKALGVSRQAIHQRASALVADIQATFQQGSELVPADIALRATP